MKWPWNHKAEDEQVEEALSRYDEVRKPEREDVEKRLVAVEAEVAAVKDAIEAEMRLTRRNP